MTLAQNRVLARLRSGMKLRLDMSVSSYVLTSFDDRRELVRYSTWETLFNKGWIAFDLQADSYVVTDAGHAAYLNASIH